MILLKLRKAGEKGIFKKCQFHLKEKNLLGLIISTEGLKRDRNKIEVIVNWHTFTCLKEDQEFVDFYNFYHRFIKTFSKTVKLLVSPTQNKSSYFW